MEGENIIPPHGGYRKLKSFQLAQLVYDVTVRFCDRYIDKRSRTHDQMVQAARSGVQNIVEGSKVSATSRKMELKLTGVARGSLEELRMDYEDYLRQRDLPLWERDDPRRKELVARRCSTAKEVAAWVREVHDRERNYGQYGPDGQREWGGGGPAEPQAPGIDEAASQPNAAAAPGAAAGPQASEQGPAHAPSSIRFIQSIRSIAPPEPRPSTYPEIAANAALVLIGVASSLLARQIDAQADTFENEGGLTERLYRVRTRHRKDKTRRPHARNRARSEIAARPQIGGGLQRRRRAVLPDPHSPYCPYGPQPPSALRPASPKLTRACSPRPPRRTNR